MAEAGSAHLVQALRASDPDRYLAALYAPPEKREALFALYAFNAEISGIRDRIREALPGELRLQWWRDVISARGQGEATGHPVADALIAAMQQHALPEAALQNYLDARIFDLYDDPMPSRTDLEGYCGEIFGAILQLSALILDAPAAPGISAAAGHAACAQGIAAMLHALPVHRARGQCFVPKEILASVGTTPEDFVTGKDDASARRAVDAMIALGREHLSAFGTGAAKLPALAKSVGQSAKILKTEMKSVAHDDDAPVAASEVPRAASSGTPTKL